MLPLLLGLLHALEPDHVAVVTGVSLDGNRRAWRVGLAFGLSHMLAVALLALTTILAGHALAGDAVFLWLDRAAWGFVILLGLWNLAGAANLRRITPQPSVHAHGALVHAHPGAKARFHHSAAWLGAFFGLGGVRGFTTLLREHGWQGFGPFAFALLLFGVGITAMFIALSWASGLLSQALEGPRGRRAVLACSGLGNLAVGLWLLVR